jgi:hypothetical protein
MASVAERADKAVGRGVRSRFFANSAIVMAALIGLSFSWTYFIPVVTRSDQFIMLRHLHGAIFFTWVVLYVAQANLVAAGRIRLHRELGIAVVAVSGAMVPLGLQMAVRGIEEHLQRGAERPFENSFYNLFDLAFFTAFMIAATHQATRRIEWHRRLIYVAAICLLGPAVSRLTGLLSLPYPLLDASASLTADLFLVALAWHDRRSMGRIHPVTIVSAAVLVPFNLVEPLLARSAAWSALAPHLYGFG